VFGGTEEFRLQDFSHFFGRLRASPELDRREEAFAFPPGGVLSSEVRGVFVAAGERFPDLVAGSEHALAVACAHPEKFELLGVTLTSEWARVGKQQFILMSPLVVERLVHHFQTQRGFEQFLIRDAHEWLAIGWRRAPAPATSPEWTRWAL